MSVSNNNIMNGNSGCNSKTRLIRLRRHGSTQLGFSIRGGWEHGTGIYVSEVHPGSEADKQGLKAGDQILRINGIHLMNSIHADVIALIKASTRLVLKVKSVGMIPIKDHCDDILTWKLMMSANNNNSCGSTPLMSSPSPVCTSSDSHSDSDIDFLETKIFIDLMGKPLGCSVAKGPVNNTGIYVQNVKFGEIADQCGLQVGDQIIEVNGVNVSQMEFSDAISKLKSLPSMTLTVKKGVGKHLFCLNAFNGGDTHSTYKNDSGFVENSSNHKKKVEAVIHHHNNGHARILSSCSNSSETSSDYGGSSNGGGIGGGKNFKHHLVVENDYSISELETSNAGMIHTQNNLSKANSAAITSTTTTTISGDNLMDIVKKEEQRLAEERRKLEDDQKKLKLEMEKLELEKKELERRKQLDECQSISGCSISSTSLSSSGSQSISFLEEIKMFSSDKNRRALKPVKSNISSDQSDDNNSGGNGNSSVTASDAREMERTKRAVVTGRYDISEKNKQHELLMEEFRRAHKRMFGQNNDSSDGINNNSGSNNNITSNIIVNNNNNNSESPTSCDANNSVNQKKLTQTNNQINQINNNNVILNTIDKIKESKSIQISATTNNKSFPVLPPPPPPATAMVLKPIPTTTTTPTVLKSTTPTIIKSATITPPPVLMKTTSAPITATKAAIVKQQPQQQPVITLKELRKIPPEVPVKTKSHQSTNGGPIVTIGTYANNTFNKNNRFAPQYHRSIIHVLSDESANKN